MIWGESISLFSLLQFLFKHSLGVMLQNSLDSIKVNCLAMSSGSWESIEKEGEEVEGSLVLARLIGIRSTEGEEGAEGGAERVAERVTEGPFWVIFSNSCIICLYADGDVSRTCLLKNLVRVSRTSGLSRKSYGWFSIQYFMDDNDLSWCNLFVTV